MCLQHLYCHMWAQLFVCLCHALYNLHRSASEATHCRKIKSLTPAFDRTHITTLNCPRFADHTISHPNHINYLPMGQISNLSPGVVYTMDPWSRPKALWNMWLVVERVLGPLPFMLRKKCQSDHGVRGPQKTYFKAFIIHWHGPMGFAMGEAREVLW